MPARTSHDELLRRKRELHLRIGRSRRRIDGRLRATKDQTRQLLSWRTYVVRYPGWALAAALGAGLAASSALQPRRISRWLGGTLMHQALGGVQQQLWNELKTCFESHPSPFGREAEGKGSTVVAEQRSTVSAHSPHPSPLQKGEGTNSQTPQKTVFEKTKTEE